MNLSQEELDNFRFGENGGGSVHDIEEEETCVSCGDLESDCDCVFCDDCGMRTTECDCGLDEEGEE